MMFQRVLLYYPYKEVKCFLKNKNIKYFSSGFKDDDLLSEFNKIVEPLTKLKEEDIKQILTNQKFKSNALLIKRIVVAEKRLILSELRVDLAQEKTDRQINVLRDRIDFQKTKQGYHLELNLERIETLEIKHQIQLEKTLTRKEKSSLDLEELKEKLKKNLKEE